MTKYDIEKFLYYGLSRLDGFINYLYTTDDLKKILKKDVITLQDLNLIYDAVINHEVVSNVECYFKNGDVLIDVSFFHEYLWNTGEEDYYG